MEKNTPDTHQALTEIVEQVPAEQINAAVNAERAVSKKVLEVRAKRLAGTEGPIERIVRQLATDFHAAGHQVALTEVSGGLDPDDPEAMAAGPVDGSNPEEVDEIVAALWTFDFEVLHMVDTDSDGTLVSRGWVLLDADRTDPADLIADHPVRIEDQIAASLALAAAQG